MSNLDQKIAQAKARLNGLQAQARKQKRRDETRRKILYGAAALALIEDLEGVKCDKFLARLHVYVRRTSDREFLGLSNKSSDDQRTCAGQGNC